MWTLRNSTFKNFIIFKLSSRVDIKGKQDPGDEFGFAKINVTLWFYK